MAVVLGVKPHQKGVNLIAQARCFAKRFGSTITVVLVARVCNTR